jgi:hypothetical protein
MSLFVSIARHDGLILQATADVASRWRQNERGYGFFGGGSLDYPGNRSLEITMNIRVRPFGHPQCFPEFPKDMELSGDLMRNGVTGLGCYAIKRGKAGVLIAVEALKDELEKNEDELIYFDKVILRRGQGSVHIRMVTSVGIRLAAPEPVGDIPEWDTQFFQGGLPSLGKRRP